MLPILQFCFHNFLLRTEPSLRVSRLDELTQTGDELFVLHDPESSFAALVLPDQIRRLLQVYALPPDEKCQDLGILDILRRGQIRAHWNEPAALIAKLAARNQVQAALALDDEGAPVGLFVPETLTTRLGGAALSREVALAAPSSVLSLPAAIEFLQDRLLEFHSESINQSAPDPSVCDGDETDGWHIIRCPCPYHRNSHCGRRSVASR